LDIFSQLTNGLSMCSAKIDVVFVLDGSGSISEADWPLVLGFVKQVSDHFVMSSSAANIGVVQFSAAAAKECELTDDAAAFGTCATSIQQMRYTTRSDLGLQKAREMLESSPRSASVQGRLVFFVGDGDADMAANEEARRLETMGQTQIFSIAVGPGANERNLKALATQEKDFFRVGQFDRLLTILGRILMASCDYDQGQAYGNNRLSTVFHTFDTMLRQWEVLDTLAKRLQYEDQSRILKGFMKLAQPVLARLGTGSTKKMVTMLLGMADEGIFAQKALTLFCPMALSPQLLGVKEQNGGYMLVKEGGFCGERGELMTTEANDAEACSALAQGAGAHSFLLGTWFRRGYCYLGTIDVDESQYQTWEENRVNPECDVGDGWVPSMIFDFYALEPPATED
jgi:hypothetical protein